MAPTQAELEKALHRAVEQNDMNGVSDLVEMDERRVVPVLRVDCPNDQGRTPLLLSLLNDNIPMARYFLNHGADADGIIDTRDESSLPLLAAAVYYREIRHAALLLEYRANTETICSYNTVLGGVTPLGAAIFAGKGGMVRLLLQHEASTDVVEARQNNTGTLDALSYACAKQQAEIVTRFIEYGLDVNVECFVKGVETTGGDKVDIKMTPLCYACWKDNLENAEVLLQNGARVVFGHYPEHPFPLGLAINYGSLSLLRLLLDNIVSNPGQVVVAGCEWSSVADYLGGRPLRHALFLKKLEVAELLVEYGANVNKQLHLVTCAYKGYLEGARFLLGAGANKNQAGARGQTPLFAAAALGHAEVVKELLKAEADLNITGVLQDHGPETPLGVAYRLRHKGCVYLLLRASGHQVWSKLREVW